MAHMPEDDLSASSLQLAIVVDDGSDSDSDASQAIDKRSPRRVPEQGAPQSTTQHLYNVPDMETMRVVLALLAEAEARP